MKKRMERVVVNPTTKKRQLVPPKLVLGFRPVDFGHLWTLDSMAYLNFPAKSKQFIDASMNKALIRKGSPFNVANMEFFLLWSNLMLF